MTLLKYLRSNQFAILIAILSVIVQSFHSFTAFYATSSLHNAWGIAQAVLFSIVIDLAILFYTVRGRRDIAMYAAVAMVAINAYYYYQHLGIGFEFIFGCFLSLIIPVSVYFYSEEIKEDVKEMNPEERARYDNERDRYAHLLETEIKDSEIDKLKKSVDVANNAYNNLRGASDETIERLARDKKELIEQLDHVTDKRKEVAGIERENIALKQEREALLSELGRPVKDKPQDNSLLNVHEDKQESITITRTGGPRA